MREPRLVHDGERLGQHPDQGHDAVERKLGALGEALVDELAQRAAQDPLEHQVVESRCTPAWKTPTTRGWSDCRQGASLAAQGLARVLPGDLHGDLPVEAQIVPLEHLSHPPLPMSERSSYVPATRLPSGSKRVSGVEDSSIGHKGGVRHQDLRRKESDDASPES